jgi:hypothetical protein
MQVLRLSSIDGKFSHRPYACTPKNFPPSRMIWKTKELSITISFKFISRNIDWFLPYFYSKLTQFLGVIFSMQQNIIISTKTLPLPLVHEKLLNNACMVITFKEANTQIAYFQTKSHLDNYIYIYIYIYIVPKAMKWSIYYWECTSYCETTSNRLKLRHSLHIVRFNHLKIAEQTRLLF